MSITMGQLATRYATAAKKTPGDKEMRTLAQTGVGLVKREIQNYHAVDTGAMLNSTTVENAGKTTYLIGPTVDYAAYVALGTSRVAARPFHIVAASKLADQVDKLGFSAKDLGL